MPNRNTTIDFFRCMAFLFVFLSHLVMNYTPTQWNVFTKLGFYTVHTVFPEGAGMGVELFFVLSGFLISGLIYKEYDRQKTFSASRFLIRRGFKIYPLYYLTLLVVGMALYFQGTPLKTSQTLANVFFYANYTSDRVSVLGHFWSLCIEEHFYFLLAGLMVLLLKWNKLNFRTVSGIYLFLFVFGIVGKLLNYSPDNLFNRISSPSHLRFDSLFFGVWLAYLYHYHRPQVSRFVQKYKYIMIAVAGILLLQNINPYMPFKFKQIVLVGINPICFGLIMLTSIHLRWFTSGLAIPCSTVGRYSYALYVVHAPVIHFLQEVITNKLVLYVTVTAATFLAGIWISKLVEIPFLSLRDRLYPSRSARPVPTQETVTVLVPAVAE